MPFYSQILQNSLIHTFKKKTDFKNGYKINRTLKEANKCYCEKKKEERMGYVRMPIIDFIDFMRVMFDTLHLFIRISEQLIWILMAKINEKDATNSMDLEHRPNLKIFKTVKPLQSICSSFSKRIYSNILENFLEQHQYFLNLLLMSR